MSSKICKSVNLLLSLNINTTKEELEQIQSQLHVDNFNVNLHNQEVHAFCSLMKWHAIVENILRQKSRIQWLQLGDSNTKVFNAAMKERQARNTVDVIYTAVGVKLTNPIDIQAEFKLF